MDTTTLKTILLEEMHAYTGDGLNAHSILTANEAEQTYAVIDFSQVRDTKITAVVLMARVIGHVVYIDHDANDKPLMDALQAWGVPAEQIVPTYQSTLTPS